MANLTPKEKLKLKITGARMQRLPVVNRDEIIEKAKTQMDEMLQQKK